MLVELTIRNFAIIDELHVEFDAGLNALTGETGAGKSILIDALGAVLGERTGSEVVRTGASSATAEAVFDLDEADASRIETVLAGLGIDLEEQTLILSRQIAAGGRSAARVNGRPVTVSALNNLGSILIDIHGQSDHLKLLQPAAQLDALDRYADVQQLRNDVRDLVRQLHAVKSERSVLRTGERERAQRVDLLRYQIDEISAAGLEPGEDDRLQIERSVLANAERLVLDAAAALSALETDDDGGANSLLRTALLHMQGIAEIDSSTSGLLELMNEVIVLAEDLASDLRRYTDSIDADPARLANLDDRIDLIQQLKRKYGSSIEEIQAHLAQAELELAQLTGSGFDDETLAAREAELQSRLTPLLGDLSARRREGANRLESEIDSAIAELGLGTAHIRIAISPLESPGETGADFVEYLFAPNQGEALKPLSRIASGGETARLMLALKSVLATADDTPTLVFDEVDVGVGARSGQAVGEKLFSLSRDHQVIVISHLPQIAAFAGSHFMIQKEFASGRTISTVRKLEGDMRLDELAEMIDGKPVSPESRAAAEQLMERISATKRTSG